MLKNIFTISDIELGKGDIFDDFKDENSLISFLKKITYKSGKNTLVLNGDTFDFLKMPYQNKFTHHITEEISLWKLEQILATYPKIFQQLSEFLNRKNNKIHFNIGNHDFDLLWPAVQKRLKQVLGDNNKVTFDHNYQDNFVYIEHGNQVDYFYKMDVEKPFLTHKGKQLLNLPLGSVAVIKYFIELKRHFPLEETIYPRHTAFEHFPEFKRMKQKIAFNFAIKGLLFNFITSLGDPISSVPYLNLIKHIFAHGLELHDESKFIRKRFKNMIRLHPGKQAYLMGHVHLTHHNIHPTENRSQIVTDTWRQEFNIKNGKPIPKAKTYAHIIYDDNNKLKKIDLLTYS
jgi:UDP-2,3-diacylglucosamine pyrophosphatase LpxH